MRIGLVANRSHHSGDHSALFRWLRHSETGIRELGLELHAVGGTYDAVIRAGLLSNYPAMRRYPCGRDGGLVKLVAGIVEPDESPHALDGVIYLVDPVDSSSIYPEAIALKRQCVVHHKPFISTVASADDWLEMERIGAGLTPDRHADRFHKLSEQTLALVAHDAKKPHMQSFVSDHFQLLSRFGRRVATGTTGKLLNELAWDRGWPSGTPWTDCYLSGPLGGDAQIANLVFERRCHRVIFFEDPHVARQHESDIQLLDRAVTAVTDHTVCMTSPALARRWAGIAQHRVEWLSGHTDSGNDTHPAGDKLLTP